MNRPLNVTLATAAVAATAILVPLAASASSSASSSSSACASRSAAVSRAQTAVNKDIATLAKDEAKSAKSRSARRHKAATVKTAKRRLSTAQRTLAAANKALTSCEVAAQPVPTVTATTTATATATATATTTATATATTTVTATPPPYTAPAAVWTDGTALLKETEPDGSAIPPLAYWDGVAINNTGFGSAWTEDPSNPGYFYGLTDRGPNVTAPDGTDKLEPDLAFQNQIGYFHLVGGTLQLVKTIGLTLPDGSPMSGLVNSEASTGETILDVYGDTLPSSATGLDSEGLVAMPDGTFWVSDEYGPYIVHFDASGKELSRFDPYATTTGTSPVFGDTVYPLPSELKRRKPNKGMEGLTITPDGKYLVGIMQSSLDKNAGVAGGSGTKSASGAITRIVKVSLTDPSDVHEYLYSLHTKGQASNPAGEAVSEITALPGDDDHFVVDERDGNFEGTSNGTATGTPKADKNLWEIDLTNATDVGPSSPLVGTTTAGGAVTYSPLSGLNVGGKSIEDIAGTKDDADAVSTLATDGITTASESLYLDYSALVTAIDPTGMYFGHDKVEGVAVDSANPDIIYLSNDSDFGITDLPAGTDPTANDRALGTDAEKFLPDGKTQDFGEVMEVDLSQVPASYK